MPQKRKRGQHAAEEVDEDAMDLLLQHEFARPSTSKAATDDDDETMEETNGFIDDEEDEADDFEEVEDMDQQEPDEEDLADYRPQLPADGIDINIDLDSNQSRRAKARQKMDQERLRRLRINRAKRELQILLHKGSFMVLLARGFYLNGITKDGEIRCLAMSHLTDFSNGDLKIAQINISFVNGLLYWFQDRFSYSQQPDTELNERQRLRTALITKKAKTTTEYLLAFMAILRSFHHPDLQVRTIYPLDVIPLKVEGLVLSDKQMAQQHKPKAKSEPKNKKPAKKSHPIIAQRNNARPTRQSQRKKTKVLSSDSSSDDDVKVLPPSRTNSGSKKKINDSNTSKVFIEAWLELYVQSEKRWICIEPVNNLVDKPSEMEKLVKHQLSYVIAVDDKQFVKDLTQRYAAQFLDNSFRKRTLQDGWVKQTLKLFRLRHKSQQEVEEDRQLQVALSLKPVPSTIDGFRNHPLYALRRHLLKYEVIFPPDAPTIGFVGKTKEPIYPRECVHITHTPLTWLKEARQVKEGEMPYKRVTSRWNKDENLDLFGYWQTEKYKPPAAKDGKVPRNKYGNVDMFKKSMLPIGCAHLRLPGLLRIANKLNIDCVPATVGFDAHSGASHPVFDGWIVCKEHKEVLIAAYDEEQENIRKREEEKREKRVLGNWKRLTKALLIRDRVKKKYGESE